MSKRPSSSSRIPHLSDAEWIVMKPLWDNEPLAARDIFSAISSRQKWSYKTLKTLLSRLVKKGALKYTQVGNSYLYSPCFSRDEMIQPEVKFFAHQVLDGSLKPFLVSFFDGRNPSHDELASLREIIDAIEQRNPTSNAARGGKKHD